MMMRVFDILWDRELATQSETLPTELIVDIRLMRDRAQLKFAIMDQLDREYESVVENLKWEEI